MSGNPHPRPYSPQSRRAEEFRSSCCRRGGRLLNPKNQKPKEILNPEGSGRRWFHVPYGGCALHLSRRVAGLIPLGIWAFGVLCFHTVFGSGFPL